MHRRSAAGSGLVARSRSCRVPPPARRGRAAAAGPRAPVRCRRVCAGPQTGRAAFASTNSSMPRTDSASMIAASSTRVRPEQLAERASHRLPTGRDGEVLADREVVEEFDRLPGAGEPELDPSMRRLRGQVTAIERDRALAADETADRVDEGGLARPVGTDQRDELARCDIEIDLREGPDAAVGHGQAAHRQHRRRQPRDGRHSFTGSDAAAAASGATPGRPG